MPLFKNILPVNIAVIYNMLMKIAAFEMFQTEGIVDQLLDLPPT